MMIVDECICKDPTNGMPQQMSFLLGNGFSTCHIVNKQQGLTKKGTPTTGKAQLRIAMQSDPMCLHK